MKNLRKLPAYSRCKFGGGENVPCYTMTELFMMNDSKLVLQQTDNVDVLPGSLCMYLTLMYQQIVT